MMGLNGRIRGVENRLLRIEIDRPNAFRESFRLSVAVLKNRIIEAAGFCPVLFYSKGL